MVAPKDPNFHANRCVELLESGNYKEAVREARKAVKLSPGKVECMKLLEIAQLLYDDASLKKPTISFREAERRGLLHDQNHSISGFQSVQKNSTADNAVIAVNIDGKSR